MVERISFEDEIRKNKAKSVILIIVMIIFFILLGYIITLVLDQSYFFLIMIFSIIFSLGYTLVGYYNSSNIALASVNAKPASRTQFPELFNSIENMSIASGLPLPKVYVMESEQINAFASGRNPDNAVICVTTGAIKKLNKHEMEGVIAHEMSHIANYDIRFMTLAAILIGMVSIIAQLFLRSLWLGGSKNDKKGNPALIIIAIVAAILAPIAVQLVHFAISRKREYGADATGVKLTRYPPGLRSALEKIKKESIEREDCRRYPKAMAPLFISNPYKKKFSNLFSTHPDIDDRIRKLNAM